MKYKNLSTYFIALVWLVNGLFCKVLGFIPRHQEIVETITNFDRPSAYFLTKLIGIAEIIMSVWVFSRIQSKLCAITQISIILTMNVLEFIYAKDLLLWGKLNFVFACLFCIFIYITEFKLNSKN